MNDLKSFDETLLSKIGDLETVSAIHEKVQRWTGGQLFLTQLLCNQVLSQSSDVAKAEGAKAVDTIVESKIIQGWRDGRAANHLKRIEEKLLRYEPRDSLLILYLQILQRGYLPQNGSPEQALLLGVGLIKLSGGQLSVSNAIYAQVFDESWIERHLPGITRPVAIVQKPTQKPKPARIPLSVPGSKSKSYLLLAAGGLGLLLSMFLVGRLA
ncbi:MAG: hypothetical protein AAF716_22610, partial [Cyanobacteria bacterium P01_D01_bin.1]